MINAQRLAVSAALCVLLASPALAQDPASPPPATAPAGAPGMAGPIVPPGMTAPGMSMKDMMEVRIKSMEDALSLTKEQKKLWDHLVTTLRKNGDDQEAAIKSNLPAKGQIPPTPGMMPKIKAIDILAQREKMMKLRIESGEKVKKALEPLYKALDDKQKDVIDMRLMPELGMFI